MSSTATAQSAYPIDLCRLDLGQRIYAALAQLLPPDQLPSLPAASIAQLLEEPPEKAMGDYALPCFRFAKELKLKPQDIAATLASSLNAAPGGWLAAAQVVGAFLNLRTDKQLLATTVVPQVLSGAAFIIPATKGGGTPARVMIEYSQPNTHKEFHVGHSRNVCLGNSLVKMYRYCGYDVVSANYFGDEGTHIATVLSYMMRHQLQAPNEQRSEWLGKLYVAAKSELAAATPAAKQEIIGAISAVHSQIESKQGDTYDLWTQTRQWSLDDFAATYAWLDVHFDVLFYESEVAASAQKIVQEYLDKDIFKSDQGAIGVDLKQYKLGFCILRKSDGNSLYATKDLALARKKFEDFHIDRNIYVVADEQNHHFRQVFKVLELMGFEQAKQCHHLSYGMVVLPEGKMSSRDGTAVSFNDLRQVMLSRINEILAKYADQWSAAEIATTAHQLCDGAIKYGMVSTDPAKEIIFNLDDWLSFEGQSGPYLMYSYARTRSILRKAADQGYLPGPTSAAALTEGSEHELLRSLFDFNRVVAVACESCKPSVLAAHLYDMCKSFNRFYVDVPVLKAEHATQRSARLALTAAFSLTLKQGLALLGMQPPERM